ncbi:bifunctional riboflavin kinase/FAD synthetase [Flavobacteriaceae bacterium]|nr:bifunctional riboflavin kinase/FAD synthetase [Flavobacteriaceae bacterium]|tara:strand:+ start:451 stop:1383 length:933 start_codon:yes stop_codon:yes gene_type:complete
MQVVQNIGNYSAQNPSILTIGTFDGVHIGHQKIIKDLVKVAKKNNLCSIVLTFFPHPRMVLQKDSDLKMIDTLEEKQQFLEKMGVDVLIVHPFSRAFSRLTALEFTRDLLVNQLKISQLVVGYDHRFGRNREATIDDLKSFGLDYNFTVDEIPSQDIESIAVSSTKIRNALNKGDLKTANQFLGRPFGLTGTVVKGDGIGKKFGFPTANIQVKQDYKLRPQNGVYLVRSELSGIAFFGMMNIGMRPTVSGKTTQTEIHFFNLDQNLYDLEISLEVLEKIREEVKFNSTNELTEQLKKDRINCEKIIAEYK